ncbi:MAG: Rieske (2Fe-2S) protein [Thermodesulfovibrionales bacterium]
MERRSFLKALAAGLGAAGGAALIWPGVRVLEPRGAREAVEPLRISRADLPPGGTLEVTFQGSPVIVINREAEGYTALSKVCTHLGCLVEYSAEQKILICPCHAGKFDLSGNVISGPPPSPLKRFPVTVEADYILVG